MRGLLHGEQVLTGVWASRLAWVPGRCVAGEPRSPGVVLCGAAIVSAGVVWCGVSGRCDGF